MSFQDVGKPAGRTRPSQRVTTLPSTVPEDGALQNSAIFSQVSDGILQYQRNVGILERIAAQVGTKADGPVLETQYKTQVDVLNMLGEKLTKQLQTQEKQLASLPRSEAARRRATHVKLTRDFHRVEQTFKNVQLDTKRKRARLAEERSRMDKETLAAQTETTEEEALQLQLQQDRLNEEIMREREEEIRHINRGMHQVNEIYKDLASIVGSQQDQIDQIETQMEDSRVNAESGLKHITKANEKASSGCTIS